jgi:hypothetical protein
MKKVRTFQTLLMMEKKEFIEIWKKDHPLVKAYETRTNLLQTRHSSDHPNYITRRSL